MITNLWSSFIKRRVIKDDGIDVELPAAKTLIDGERISPCGSYLLMLAVCECGGKGG